MSRIIISSYMVRYPLGGMMSYTAQWLVGFAALGHDVYLVEKAGYPRACYNPVDGTMTDDCSYGAGVVSALLSWLNLSNRWCYVDNAGTFHGLMQGQVASLFETADLLIDLGNHGAWLDEAARITRVLVDGEPAFTQMKMMKRLAAGEALPVYDLYYTVGQNIGTSYSPAPTAGISWRHVFYPVSLNLFSVIDPPDCAPFTTVMNWQSHQPLEFDGRVYGQKDVEFAKFTELPRLTDCPIEIAVAGKQVPRAELVAAGWGLRDAHATTVSFDGYRDYIAQSRGEFCVCKHVFVATASGWFGDRSAAYLASGRPVVMQDTGFGRHLPCGEGLFAVSTAEEAAEAITRVSRDYRRHSAAGRAIAREFLDTNVVLPRLLREAGL